MDIEIYEEMALYQTKIAINNLLKRIKIHDYLIMHRYGNLKPGEIIIFVIVASEHRKEGFIFIQDRIKDMIVSGAENIYPAEVERAIFEHPAVADTAVVGIPDDQWGETVLAFIALKPKHTLDLESLQTFCRERMAGYKIPSKLQIIDAIPRNASGKSLKTKLRQPYWEGKKRQVS